ncbi:MAG: energy transducer TonB [Terriglobales bacterium]
MDLSRAIPQKAMFQQLPSPQQRTAFWLSLGLHGALLYLVISAGPRFIQPSSIAFGNAGSGTSSDIIYLGPSAVPHQTAPNAPRPKAKHRSAPKLAAAKVQQEPSLDAPVESARAGSILGSSSTGPQTGYESRPALPVVFPNPAVDRSDIPTGVAGDVIVEVTIDAKGNVANAKVLQSLGYGLEDKVLEALKNWRFTPATMNGVAIASRQDVHFHFPS